MPRYMLDSDISSYVMKRSNDAVLRKMITIPLSEICVSAITKSEVLFGVAISPRKHRDQAAAEAYFRYIDVLDFPADAASHYADIRADLKAQGTMIGPNDLFIAAHARRLNLILVTNNTREFERVKDLKIENWTK